MILMEMHASHTTPYIVLVWADTGYRILDTGPRSGRDTGRILDTGPRSGRDTGRILDTRSAQYPAAGAEGNKHPNSRPKEVLFQSDSSNIDYR